ncbi:MAG: amidohydrolase family protein [Phycisphaerales bacterium]
MQTRIRRVLSALIASVVFGGSAAAGDVTILAPRAVMPDGSLADRVRIVIDDDGRIKSVATGQRDAAAAEADTTVIRFEQGVLSPGLIDLGSSLGVTNDDRSNAASIDADPSMIDAFDPLSDDLREAARSGITAALITPAPNAVLGGRAAIVRTATLDPDQRVIDRDGPFVLTIGPSAWDLEFGPSSRAGALYELRQALDDATGQGSFAGFDGKSEAMYLRAASFDDLQAALRVLNARDVKPVVQHTHDLVEIPSEAYEATAGLVAGPLTISSSPRDLSGPSIAHANGAAIAFSSGRGQFRDSEALRRTATLATRYGLDAAAARRGLTSEAARMAGVGDTIGSLAEGMAADLVLFSEDPLRPDARVLEVWVQGDRIFSHQYERNPLDDQRD